MPLEPFERHGHQKPRRHDAIGVDVVAAQRQAAAGSTLQLIAPESSRLEALRVVHAGTPSSISRTSTTSPAIAAAATIAGLMSSVRPVGLPWRPLKLRFDDEARHLTALEPVGIHAEAHRAAGAAPFEAGLP